MIPGSVHRSPGICLIAEENLSYRRPYDEGAVRPIITSNGVAFLKMKLVGSHSTSGREKEGKKERTGRSKQDFEVKPHPAKFLSCVCAHLNSTEYRNMLTFGKFVTVFYKL